MNAVDRIEQLHTHGVETFGGDWFAANAQAVTIIVASGLQPNEHRLLGALIATRICQAIAVGREQAKDS